MIVEKVRNFHNIYPVFSFDKGIPNSYQAYTFFFLFSVSRQQQKKKLTIHNNNENGYIDYEPRSQQPSP